MRAAVKGVHCPTQEDREEKTVLIGMVHEAHGLPKLPFGISGCRVVKDKQNSAPMVAYIVELTPRLRQGSYQLICGQR